VIAVESAVINPAVDVVIVGGEAGGENFLLIHGLKTGE